MNEGGDKVTRDELRASKNVENLTGTIKNRAWDGASITLSGARNEVISFNMVLEAANSAAAGVAVSFDKLTGPNGATIATAQKASGNGVFNWVNRPIELFYMRYLQIKGMSGFGWYHGSETQIPPRMQAASHLWKDRPDHNKYYPDILVPLELVPTFTVAAGQNQSIWGDIYIPKSSPAGVYTGTVTITEGGAQTRTVPVSLTVQPFTLPDTPSIKGFTNLDATDVMWRYATGTGGYVGWQSPDGKRVKHVADVYYQLFHRHRIDLMAGETENIAGVGISSLFTPRYDGSLFTAANGYDGPGVSTGVTLYVVGPYGSWGRNIFDEKSMWNFADPIGNWFANNFPNLQYFIYLQDEPSLVDFPQVEAWAKWLAEDPGPGHNMLSMSTVGLAATNALIPDLNISAASNMMGECPLLSPNACDNTAFTTAALATLKAKPNRYYIQYGGWHPGSGTTNTEDDGIAMRTWAWAQSKLGIDRWFSWYANLPGSTDFFQQACTWGCDSRPDALWGEISDHAYTNGNGVLVYPGTDISNPSDSYGVDGPFASLRLKEWRRGNEDGDYITIAKSIDPAATAAVLAQVMPRAIWENHDPSWPLGDPSYYNDPPSWSSDPDSWEAGRAQLAAIIAKGCTASPSAAYCK